MKFLLLIVAFVFGAASPAAAQTADGLVSPAFAMGAAIAKFSRVMVPAKARTTFNVGVVGGGTSVNSIPTGMFMDVDMRSESPGELNKRVTTFQAIVREAVEEENRTRSTAQGKVGALSLGIPAVTIGRGRSARSHALDESVDIEKQSSVRAARVVLTVILAAAQ